MADREAREARGAAQRERLDRLAAAGAPAHPAKMSGPVLTEMVEVAKLHIPAGHAVLDPFAGVGCTVDALAEAGFMAQGVEIEAGWAAQSANVREGDSRRLPWGNHSFRAVATSPTYGNRMADKGVAPDHRGSVISYAHYLRRELSAPNTGRFRLGSADYERLHSEVWAECDRVLSVHGVVLLNCKQFRRAGEWQDPAALHLDLWSALGWQRIERHEVAVRGVGGLATTADVSEAPETIDVLTRR